MVMHLHDEIVNDKMATQVFNNNDNAPEVRAASRHINV